MTISEARRIVGILESHALHFGAVEHGRALRTLLDSEQKLREAGNTAKNVLGTAVIKYKMGEQWAFAEDAQNAYDIVTAALLEDKDNG